MKNLNTGSINTVNIFCKGQVSDVSIGECMEKVRAAMRCHEALERYRQIVGEEPMGEWQSVPRWRRDGYVKAVVIASDNPELRPETEHDLWVSYYYQQGWSFGKKLNHEKKKHPCMVEWVKLPDFQKFKSELFLNVARSNIYGKRPLSDGVSTVLKNMENRDEALIREALRLNEQFKQ